VHVIGYFMYKCMTKWAVWFLLHKCITHSHHQAVYCTYTVNTIYISNGSERSHFLTTGLSSSLTPPVSLQSF